MKLSNLWKEKEVTLSFEAFPPKRTATSPPWPSPWKRSPSSNPTL